MFPNEIKGLKATYLGNYRSSTGNGIRFRFSITGSPVALAAYEKARGQYFIKDEATGQLIFTTSDTIGLDIVEGNGKLLITTNGSIVPDRDIINEMLEDKFMYRQALATAKANAFVAKQAGGIRTPRVLPATFTSVEPLNQNLEVALTPEEEAALAAQHANEPVLP